MPCTEVPALSNNYMQFSTLAGDRSLNAFAALCCQRDECPETIVEMTAGVMCISPKRNEKITLIESKLTAPHTQVFPGTHLSTSRSSTCIEALCGHQAGHLHSSARYAAGSINGAKYSYETQ